MEIKEITFCGLEVTKENGWLKAFLLNIFSGLSFSVGLFFPLSLAALIKKKKKIPFSKFTIFKFIDSLF